MFLERAGTGRRKNLASRYHADARGATSIALYNAGVSMVFALVTALATQSYPPSLDAEVSIQRR